MIRNILFDMDMTLLDFHKAEYRALQSCFLSLQLKFDEHVYETYHRINREQWQMLEQGVLSREQLKYQRFAILFRELGVDMEPQTGALQYESYLAEGYFYMPGAKELLRRLVGKYHLYIVSNGLASVQHRRIAGAKLEDFFEGIYISEEVGYDKPDKRFFQCCFEDIAKKTGEMPKKDETILIGDSLTSDVQGGKNFGVKTIWFHPPGMYAERIKPDYEVTRLEEIEGLLKQI